MARCYEEGLLRAYMDKELAPNERDAITAHLRGCQACQQRLDALQNQHMHIATMLAQDVAIPDPHRMLKTITQTAAQATQPTLLSGTSVPYGVDVPGLAEQPTNRRKTMKTPKIRNDKRQPLQTWVVGLAVMLVAVGLLALPPVRALADQFLHIFRVQEVMFVPVNSEHMQQLEDLNIDGRSLLMGEPTVINDPGEPLEVASTDEASDHVGSPIYESTALPAAPISTTVHVQDRATFAFQVNVESAQQVLDFMEIDDVTIPLALGDAPIRVDVPWVVVTRYYGEEYEMLLMQGQSPEVALPEGVDLAEMGKATLRVLGMDEYQAAALSQNIDWSSTLVVPFPADLESMRQVTVNGANGLLTDTSGRRRPGPPHTKSQNDMDSMDEDMSLHKQLYWQDGDRFYVLVSTGEISSGEMITAAESVR